jgi:hypothetical protein
VRLTKLKAIAVKDRHSDVPAGIRARMSHMGQNGNTLSEQMFPALPPTADMASNVYGSTP